MEVLLGPITFVESMKIAFQGTANLGFINLSLLAVCYHSEDQSAARNNLAVWNRSKMQVLYPLLM